MNTCARTLAVEMTSRLEGRGGKREGVEKGVGCWVGCWVGHCIKTAAHYKESFFAGLFLGRIEFWHRRDRLTITSCLIIVN